MDPDQTPDRTPPTKKDELDIEVTSQRDSSLLPMSKKRFRVPIRQEKMAPAFWTVASIISLIMNIILVVAVILLAARLFTVKSLVEDMVTGLYRNFELMDQAHIKTEVPVSDRIPVKFNLKLDTDTVVVLTEDTLINGARVSLTTGGLSIVNAPTDIILPAGSRLPVHLNLVVPVNQKIPVNILANVDIPLNQTELHQPFTGLQDVVSPYQTLLSNLPNSWNQVFCWMTGTMDCK